MQEIRSMGKNNNSIRYLFLTLKLSEIKDSGKQGFTTTYINIMENNVFSVTRLKNQLFLEIFPFTQMRILYPS